MPEEYLRAGTEHPILVFLDFSSLPRRLSRVLTTLHVYVLFTKKQPDFNYCLCPGRVIDVGVSRMLKVHSSLSYE